jgi:4-hydroxy-2-oxoheptanedioate aldolase
MKRADEEICLLVQVETRKGLENLDEIARVEGVDGVFLGPADLSAALGHPGNLSHPEVTAAVENAVERIAAAGKPSGTFYPEEAQSRHWIGKGCTFVAVGADVLLLARSAEALANKFKQRGKNDH